MLSSAAAASQAQEQATQQAQIAAQAQARALAASITAQYEENQNAIAQRTANQLSEQVSGISSVMSNVRNVGNSMRDMGQEINRLTLNDTQINNIKDVINRNVNLTLEQITDTLLPRPFKDDSLKLNQRMNSVERRFLHNFVPDEINGLQYSFVCYIKVNINSNILNASSINSIKNEIEMKLNTNIIPYLQTADKHQDIINEINNIINIPELVFTIDAFNQPNATAPGGGTLENYYLGYQVKKIPEYSHLDNEFLRKVSCIYNRDIMYWTVLHNLPPIAIYEILNPYMLLFGGYRLVKYEFTEDQKRQLRLDYNLDTSVEIPYIEYLIIFYENCYENRTENNISDFATHIEDLTQQMLNGIDYRIVMRTLKNNYDENKNIFYMPSIYSFGKAGAIHISNHDVEDKNLRKIITVFNKMSEITNINIYTNFSGFLNGTYSIDEWINRYFDNGGYSAIGVFTHEVPISLRRKTYNVSGNNISGYFKSGDGAGCLITRFVDEECPINASNKGFEWPFVTFIHEFTHQIHGNIKYLGIQRNSSSFSFRESLNFDPPRRNIVQYSYILFDKIEKMYDKHLLEYSVNCTIGDNSHYSCKTVFEFLACFTELWFYVLKVISVPGGGTMWQNLFDKIRSEDNTDYSNYEHSHFGICSFNDLNIYDNLKIVYTTPAAYTNGTVDIQEEILLRDLFHEIYGVGMKNPCNYKFLNRGSCESFKNELCPVNGDIFSQSLVELRQLNPSSQQQQLQGASSRADTPLAALWNIFTR